MLKMETSKHNRSYVRQKSVEIKVFKQKVKKLHLRRIYSAVRHLLIFLGLKVLYKLNFKNRGHLKFTVKLSFYVLFLCLICSASYKIFTSRRLYIINWQLDRIGHFNHKTALKKQIFQSDHFSQPNHDNNFTLYLIKVALTLLK